jgi:UPF0716 protein FxsA
MIGLIVLVAVPLIELAILIKAGQWIGFWPTLAIVMTTFVIGAVVVSRSGLSSAMKTREALARGDPPVTAMLEGALLAVGGVLLMTPGLIADVAGLLLLLPPVRTLMARMALRNAMVAGEVRVERHRTAPTAAEEFTRQRPDVPDAADGPVIDGEFERLDERPAPGSKASSNGRSGGDGATGGGNENNRN